MSQSCAKRSLRNTLLQKRQQLTQLEIDAKSLFAQTLLLGLPVFRQARVLALYSPIRNEVATALLHKAALSAGKKVCYPRVNGDQLSYYEIHSLEDLGIGNFGVCEPAPLEGRVVDPVEIELLLVPGVAFDQRGYRLGYGRGYFDRFLSSNRFLGLSVGFCFHFQLVETLPVEEHDQGVALLVTNNGIYSPLSS
ncbi:5-formyltetrahydrofolate cyclo-ligase [Geopsychrobacter electrodiphilus]|uniref:5-formyltetrahydrofolate cyclo-ligase n=1 Tax=Geopsychrobacter electrodiphilus TaxID=225196 RepID=UPI0003659A5B|nr:5-formyltetrahydrofolate cyclo-ligase [Geopsychrobacter electrodiphilus]